MKSFHRFFRHKLNIAFAIMLLSNITIAHGFPTAIDDNDNRERVLVDKLLDAEENRDTKVVAATLSELIGYYLSLNEIDQVEVVSLAAIDKLENKQGVEQELVQVLSYLATVKSFRGKYQSAQQLWSRALQYRSFLPDHEIVALIFNKGLSYAKTGEFKLAEHFYYLALDAAFHEHVNQSFVHDCIYDRETLPIQSSIILIQLSKLWRNHNQPGDKVMRAQECADAVLENTDYYHRIVAKAELAKSFFLDNQQQKALALSNVVLNDQAIRHPQYIDMTLLQLKIEIETLSYNDKENVINALKNTNFVVTEPLSKTSNALDLIYKLQSVFKLSNGFYHSKLTNADGILYPTTLLKILNTLLKLHSSVNDIDNGHVLFKQASQLSQKYTEGATNPFAWRVIRGTTINAYMALLASSATKALSENQFSTYELIDFIANDFDYSPTSDQRVAGNNYSEMLSSDQTQLNLRYEDWLDYQRSLSLNATITLEQHQALAIKKDEFLTQITPPTNRESSDDVLAFDVEQADIPSNVMVLRYVMTNESSYVVALSRFSKSIFALPPTALIDEAVSYYNDRLLHNGKRNEHLENILNSLLPSSVLAEQEILSLVVIPDGSLYHLPFASLRIDTSESQQQYLIDKYSVSYSFSIREYLQASIENTIQSYDMSAPEKLEQIDTGSIAVFANPFFNAKAKDLVKIPETVIESDAIQRTFPNSKIQTVKLKNATKSFLLAQSTRNSNILHIATHGIVNKNNPEILGLLVAPEADDRDFGFLTLSELHSYPFNNQLTVIAGCETSVGQYYKNTGVNSISRGFIASGVDAVIASRWPIQDRATSLFMRNFYQHLRAQNGKINRALQLTQQQFATSGRYRHPKFWAGFTLHSKNWHSETLDFLTSS